MNIVIFSLLLVAITPQSAPRPLVLESCAIDGVARPARCATYRVPERRDRPGGRTVPLRIVVVAPERKQHADPIVFLAGGPGQGAAQLASLILQQLNGIDAGREVVLLDQRGTGESNPLRCEAGFELLAPARRADLLACRDALARHADLSAYGTEAAVEDVEAVRAALGYESINLVAASYGTRPALEYMRRFGSRVRTAMLRAALPAGFNIIRDGGTNAEAALTQVLDDCRADAACVRSNGDVHGHLQRLRATLAASSTGIDVPLASGKAFRLTETLFAQTLYALLLNADTRQMIPGLLKRSTDDGLAAIGSIASGIAAQIYASAAFGMYLSVVCGEDAAPLRARPRGDAEGDRLTAPILDACAVWPASPPLSAATPTELSTPTLLLSGTLDPATTPATADRMGPYLRNSRHFVFPATAHMPFAPACAAAALRRFLDDRDVQAVELGCASDLKLKPLAR